LPTTIELLNERAIRANKIARAAQRKAAKIATDAELHRSTRQRRALTVKAEALDQIADVLAGKAPPG